MADIKSNADVDLRHLSRDGSNSKYMDDPAEQAPGAGPSVVQILGKPAEAKDSDAKAKG